MTKQREFKLLIRERMSKTGESYTAARAQILKKLNGSPDSEARYPGLLPGYDRFGGVQSDTAVICNVLRHAGIKSPLTGKPYTEAMIHGLCGGPGFLYAVFEYKGWPPMLTITTRNHPMPDAFAAAGMERLGVKFTKKESTSTKPAQKALDDALAAGKAALCVADIAVLPWYGLPKEFAGSAPHMLAVVGRDGDDAWIDDRAPRPLRLKMETLAVSRAAYRKGKNRLYTVEGEQPKYDGREAIRSAIAAAARGYVEPPVPRSFWSNCGLAGLRKWHALLTDAKDKKGWPGVFSDGARAYSGLQRAYQCIEHEFTAPAAGRPFYAEFLDEASDALGKPALRLAADAFRKSGELWATAARTIAQAPDKAVRQACEISDRRPELTDEAGPPEQLAQLWQKRHKLGEECRLTREAAREVYAQLAATVAQIVGAEEAAVKLLSA